MTTDNADCPRQPSTGGAETLEEQLRRKGVQPIQSEDDLACDGIFETDEELDEFLAYLRGTPCRPGVTSDSYRRWIPTSPRSASSATFHQPCSPASRAMNP